MTPQMTKMDANGLGLGFIGGVRDCFMTGHEAGESLGQATDARILQAQCRFHIVGQTHGVCGSSVPT